MLTSTVDAELYLSRLFPNLRSHDVRRDLADAYEMHRTLMRGFPDAADGGPGRVLWRLETPRGGGPPMLLVQSDKPPDWSCLRAEWLCPPERLPPQISRADDQKQWTPEFAADQRLRFRLRANPTKRVHQKSLDATGQPVDPSWVGKRVELRHEEEQLAWLLNRTGPDSGFSLPTFMREGRSLAAVDAVPEGKSDARLPQYVADRQKTGDRKSGGRLFAVRFEGILTVTDPGNFAATMRAGIGPAKAFGFGLLSVAPVR